MYGNSMWNKDQPDFYSAYGGMGSGSGGYGPTGGMGGMGTDPGASMEYDAADTGGGMPYGAILGAVGSNTDSSKAAAAGGPPSMSGDVMGGASKGASAGPWGAAIGAGVGLLKFSGDQEAYKQQGLLAANRDRLSYINLPGRQGEMPKPISPWSNALAFGSQGAAYGQGMDNARAQSQLQQAYINNMNAGTAAINKGQFAPVAQYGSMGPQRPSTPVSDSIWADPYPNMGPDGYSRSQRWGT